MSIGFTYRIDRTREDTSFRRMEDRRANLLRLRDPNNTNKFYDFAAEILAGTEHVLKFYDNTNAFTSSHVITSVEAHIITVATSIDMVPPAYGAGDTYEILRREVGGSLTQIATGNVGEYLPLNRNTYRMKFQLRAVTGLPPELFLLKRANDISLTNGVVTASQGPVEYERVVTADEAYRLPNNRQFVFDNNKAGYQWYRGRDYEKLYKTREDADNASASLLAQLMILVAQITAPDVLNPAFAVTPGSGTIQIGQKLTLDAIGDVGGVTWSFKQNESAGTLNTQGTYVAGPNTGTDIIEAADSAGNKITLTFTVQDTFTSAFEGTFSWQLS